jgi:hypothetical protein
VHWWQDQSVNDNLRELRVDSLEIIQINLDHGATELAAWFRKVACQESR